MPTFKLLMEFDESGALKAVRKLDDIADAAEKAQDSLENVGKAGSQGLRNLSDKAGLARKALDLLGKGMKFLTGIGISIGAVEAIGRLIDSSRELKDELDGLEKQFNALGARAGWTQEEMAGLEKLMVQNGIGAVEARKNVMALTAAWIDSGKGAPLLAAALDSTVISGKSVEETFKSMTQAIENGNAKSLEAIGIYANFDEAYENMAKKIGTTVDGLTEQERAQARADQTLAAAAANAGLYEASLDDAERAQNELQASLTELKLEIADAFGSETVALIEAVADAVRMLGDLVSWTKGVFGGLGAVIRSELSLGELAGMNTEQRNAHLANYNNEEWVKKQLAAAKGRLEEQRSNLRFALTDSDTGAYQKAEQEVRFYTEQLERIAKQKTKAQIAERQQEAKHQSDMAALREKADKDEQQRMTRTSEGRKALVEKDAANSLAIQKRALENRVISEEEYNQRIIAIEKDKNARLEAIDKGASRGRSGSGASGRTSSGSSDAAIKQLDNYIRKIELLNGTSSKASQEIEKTLDGIARTGQAQGLPRMKLRPCRFNMLRPSKQTAL